MSINTTVENVYLRQHAMLLTRWRFWRLLGITAIVYVITNALDAGLTALGDALMHSEIQELVAQYTRLVSSSGLTSSDPLVEAVTALFLSPKFLLFNLAFVLVTGLIDAGLHLCLTRQILDTSRGGTPELAGVFRLMKHCVKAWGVQLWSGFKALLWALPGGIVMLIGNELMLYDLLELGNTVQVIGLALTIGLSIPALLRYALASLILADEPDRGIRECVTFSAGLMKGRKWQYVRLSLPGLMKFALAFWAADLLISAVLSACGLDYERFVQLYLLLATLAASYFALQVDMAHALFYLKRRTPEASANGKPQPVSYWLREHTETDIPEESPEEAEPADEAAEPAPEADPEVDA